MGLDETFDRIQRTIDVRRVFGEAYAVDGATVIPVAAVAGGAGGGSGTDEADNSGEGGGFGGTGRPVGAYVITGGDVSWVPAVDVNRLVGWGGLVTIVLVLSVGRVQRLRQRRRRRGVC